MVDLHTELGWRVLVALRAVSRLPAGQAELTCVHGEAGGTAAFPVNAGGADAHNCARSHEVLVKICTSRSLHQASGVKRGVTVDGM